MSLENADAVTKMSVQELARTLEVAESSIVRFSKLTGCSGFSEFKLMLVRCAPRERRTIFEDVTPEGLAGGDHTQGVFTQY